METDEYEIYTLIDVRNNGWNVLELKKPMSEEKIDFLCVKYGIDEVCGPAEAKNE
jgi:hypothetical protein